MGTEVLRPQDCFLRPSPSAFRGPTPRSTNNSRLPHAAAAGPFRKPAYPSRPDATKKRREGSPKSAKPGVVTAAVGGGPLVMGQLTILKRGQSLDSVRAKKKKAANISIVGGGGGNWLDPAVFGTGRLGPDPNMIPKKIRLKQMPAQATPLKAAGEYAGSAFELSPSPRKLPLPSFSWSCSATKDLRRLLRLE